MKRCTLTCALFLAFVACTSGSNDVGSSSGADPAPTKVTEAIPTAEVHDAMCGHAIEGVGHCGNYVMLDGKYVVLEHPSLGAMEFCEAGKKGAKIEITGAMKDGKFVASTYRRVE